MCLENPLLVAVSRPRPNPARASSGAPPLPLLSIVAPPPPPAYRFTLTPPSSCVSFNAPLITLPTTTDAPSRCPHEFVHPQLDDGQQHFPAPSRRRVCVPEDRCALLPPLEGSSERLMYRKQMCVHFLCRRQPWIPLAFSPAFLPAHRCASGPLGYTRHLHVEKS